MAHRVLPALLLSRALAQVDHDGSACIGPENTYPPDYFFMEFFNSTLRWSNLGDAGPDTGNSPTIYYEHVGVFNGGVIDLEVSVTTGEYRPVNILQNGYSSGQAFGQINLGGKKSHMDDNGASDWNTVALTYTFLSAETGQPVVIPRFAFSFFDFDDTGQTQSGTNNDGGRKGQECLTLVTPIDSVAFATETTLKDENGADISSSSSIFCSSTSGVEADNPTVPSQANFQNPGTSVYDNHVATHAVGFEFTDTSTVLLTYAALETPESGSSIGTGIVGNDAVPGGFEAILIVGGFVHGFETPPPSRRVFAEDPSQLPGFDATKVTETLVADVNGDGWTDLLTSGISSPVRIYLATGENSVESLVGPIELGTTSFQSNGLAVADVDNDGDMDIVMIDSAGPIWLFLAPHTYDVLTLDYNGASSKFGGSPGPGGRSCLTVADLDADGFVDIVVGGGHGEANVIYFGNTAIFSFQPTGSAGFETRQLGLDADSLVDTTGMAVADLNLDGHLDIVVANRGFDSLVFLGQGGRDQWAVMTPTTLGMPYEEWQYTRIGADWQFSRLSTTDVTVADFDEDGVPDVAASHDGAPNMLYLGDGSGDFSAVQPAPIGPAAGPDWYQSADENDGTARITWGQYKGEVGDSVSIDALDVDRDGHVDLVVGERDQTARVYFNTFTPAPINSWGSLSVRTVVGAPYDLGPLPVGADSTADEPIDSRGFAAAVDLNGDGYPDVLRGTDLLINPGSGDFSNVVPQPFWLEDALPLSGTQNQDPLAERSATPKAVLGLDVDNDGDTDLLVSPEGPGPIYVLLNPGNGLVATNMHLNGWWGPDAVTLLDFYTESLGIKTEYETSKMVSLDLNGDGKLDVIAANTDQLPQLWLNDWPAAGHYDFALSEAFVTTGPVVADIALADVNGDGHIDAVMAATDKVGGWTGFFVVLNPLVDSTAEEATVIDTWQQRVEAGYATRVATSDTALQIAAADMNNDGIIDVVVGGSERIAVYFGTRSTAATGDYTSVPSSCTPPETGTCGVGEWASVFTHTTLRMVVADVDGDGWQDIVASYTDGASHPPLAMAQDTSRCAALGTWTAWTGSVEASAGWSSDVGWARMGNGYNQLHGNGLLGRGCFSYVFWDAPATTCEYARCPAGATLQTVRATEDGEALGYSCPSCWPSHCPCLWPLPPPSPPPSADNYYKRIYYGKRIADTKTSKALASWPLTLSNKMGPDDEDDWRISSLEIVDLNLDGNLDMFPGLSAVAWSTGTACLGRLANADFPVSTNRYAADGQPAKVALGKSQGGAAPPPMPFDAMAVFNQQQRMRELTFGPGSQMTQDPVVAVGAAFHQHAYAGTTNSECRAPADDFYPVQTRIDIEFPIVECTKEDLKDCIILDPIQMLSSTLDNAANDGIVAG